ncbi:MAG: hypothetical protein DA330_03370 [Nitrososphaera sp.]|nr:hypothetical protein [Nitrososphaera sp.]
MEIDTIILLIHLAVGFFLVFLAAKAFKKTRYPPMGLLAIGFSMIVLGDTVVGDAISGIASEGVKDVVEELIEISGFVVLILAVKKS